MKSQKSVLGFLLVILITSKVASAVNEEVANATAEAEKKVDSVEKQLIRNQAAFKKEVRKANESMIASRELLKANKQLPSVLTIYDSILKNFLRLANAKNFSLSKFNNLNSTSCKKINEMITDLEADVEFYLKAIKGSEDGAHSLSLQSKNLKIEYFSNFIFFNTTESESVLRIIALHEKLVEKIQNYQAFLFSSSYQIANILYDIKVTKYKICDKKNTSSKPKEKSSTKAKKTTAKLPTSTTKKVSGRISDDDDQD